MALSSEVTGSSVRGDEKYFRRQGISEANNRLPLERGILALTTGRALMQRRILAKTAFIGAAMVAVLPRAGRAADVDLFENVVFTEGNPGHWRGVEALHVPVVTVTGGMLMVRTPHPMTKPHFIVSHTVVLADGALLGRKTFTYMDQPVSEHMLSAGYSGKVTITSTCNLHDFWVKVVSV
jgi:superoxide reductase